MLCQGDNALSPCTRACAHRGEFRGLIPSWRTPGLCFSLFLTAKTWIKPTARRDVTFQEQLGVSVAGSIQKWIHLFSWWW